MTRRFKNPWASDAAEPEVAPTPAATGELAPVPRDYEDPNTGKLLEAPTQTLFAPGYGGLRVRHARTPTEALLRVLEFFKRHQAALDALLVDYEVLVTHMAHAPQGGFYVQRADGWTLVVPSATAREHALAQITQALLAIVRSPHAGLLQGADITVFRQ